MKHGGDLTEAANHYQVDEDDWLDLSTGINPMAYPFRLPSDAAWQKLPQARQLNALLLAARKAYRVPEAASVLAGPGSQILIQLLPRIRPASRVAIMGHTYSEHTICWRQAGASVSIVDRLACPADADVLVVVNPNNPDGRIWSPDQLLECAHSMEARGGLMILDEAFADVAPEVSLAPRTGIGSLLVLRSFGKFFGLAGIRLGFAVGPEQLLSQMDAQLGPWAVSGPAMEIGTAALADLSWQQGARARCYRLSAQLDDVLAGAGFNILGGTALFRLAAHAKAQAIHNTLARKGIWVRRFDDAPDRLRFGLPGDDVAFDRLAAALGSEHHDFA